ncbi:homeotic protein spalt-major-like isoform X3 [Macrosteles quadrilineatus]|uniref:homeotic protein spalt-major-like isoform X3 n=1 Tax=Macrosteles quadrilineatus TaxID=74068 RepID=UPI0023E0DDC9|nr:homeotic protein spalt-major-like isoform X3 [Macrosteles quadrilineatus]
MSRRKQARPIRVFESEDGLETEAPQNGDGPITDSEEEATSPRDDNVCDNCNAEFSNAQEAEDHRKECIPPKDVEVLDSPGSGENDEMPLSGDEEDEESSLPEEGKRQEEVRRQKQDAENNNSVEDGETEGEGEDLPLGFPFQLPAAAAAGHVTLEALQNTKVAVAQFAATAMANNTDNAAALQELAVLQSTLYTLQTQQMMQLNLIQQLQQQLQITRPKDGSPTPPLPLTITPRPSHSPLPPSLPKPSRTPTPVKQEIPMAITTPTTQSVPASAPQATTPTSAPKPVTASPPIHTPSLPPCSISSSFASSIITNLDPPPSPSEPNTLEMLQRRAQEVLDNASQGLLANNLADELAFRKNGGKSMSPYDSKTGGRNEPFFKHRCRYCGKVFGSDSALQIHIRSHTGERPFKCNVCGSRFTTKGNLKVHFQRHTSKFPHIKMNPNPVPEHLDKYHPPLLAQMGAHQSLPPGVPAHHPHNSQPPHHHQFPGSPPFPPTGLPMFRPQHDLVIQPHHQSLIKPVLPIPLFGPRQDLHQEAPENLSKPVLSTHSTSPPPSESSDHFKKEMSDDDGPIPLTMCTTETTEEPVKSDERLTPKTEAEGEMEQEQERYSPMGYDECSSDSKYSHEDMLGTRESPEEKHDDSLQDQPENLSNKMNGEKSPPGSSPSGSEGQLTPSPQTHLHSHLLPRPTQRPPSPAASESGSLGALDLTPRTSTGVFSGFGLLPTSALSSLTSSVLTSTAFSPMGLAVGPAVRGNTTCNICFKTFACNSALEIHYRSHTKERPFKCTICDRGFSTKGNMKQHMLTHKIRDMPSHLFEQKSPTDDTSNASSESRDIGSVRALEAPQTPTQPPVGPPLTPTGPPPPKEPNLQQQLQLYQSPQHHQHQHHQQHQQHQHQHHQPPPPPQPVKRSPEESILPLPKRQPSLPKHLCHVCNKNFSSSSALQIHMRTHTGDKPFRCTICHKAFTTKGNLKVHMGTHMWTNGASRRGRRMSLDLPPLPITPKDSDFLHRRPDLFYPYLPAPFLNGMQQKLNEISVIQNVGSNMSNGLLGFGGYRALEMKPGSPGSEKQPLGSPQHRSTPPLWDLHYDRKPPTAPDSPPAHVPPPRGEGLAA